MVQRVRAIRLSPHSLLLSSDNLLAADCLQARHLRVLPQALQTEIPLAAQDLPLRAAAPFPLLLQIVQL
jgi:hypothetical protein